MKFHDRLDEACRSHDIHDILGTTKKKIVCPLPTHIHSANPTPSFSIFWKEGRQYFACHGNCHARGDVVDLVGYMRIAGYDPYQFEMKKKALEMLDQRFSTSVVIPKKETSLTGHEWIDFTPPGVEAREYAHGRGLSDATIKKFNLGQSDHWLTIPCFEDYKLTGIKMRNLKPGGLRYMSLRGSKQGLFNFDAVAYSTGVVIVVKGEIPAMLLDQMGYLACAPTGGEGGWREDWRTALALCTPIVVGDNDVAGRVLGERRAALLGARLVFPPESYKDIDAFILAEPERAKAALEEWKGGAV
jgi:hypothetical protein